MSLEVLFACVISRGKKELKKEKKKVAFLSSLLRPDKYTRRDIFFSLSSSSTSLHTVAAKEAPIPLFGHHRSESIVWARSSSIRSTVTYFDKV
ncbi:hypothetical protein HS088_TW14G00747 [Tripterygium wilfordii]|uniref:Uncharacterized protein n=1 Tax=Tripterygium wilfordii TaxID=458696 RepID=A0A7J7CR66_TRIWF|nr:hypothetical protein HS088_TW14G00747 [Tripterygium wilfordii]